ncbi:hypothetical protein [Denitromonas sp.]|uniref:hypothetical protein n=1 Tax=Denitromonas sp. TaxID=2734609 RepID=UPI003A8B7433
MANLIVKQPKSTSEDVWILSGGTVSLALSITLLLLGHSHQAAGFATLGALLALRYWHTAVRNRRSIEFNIDQNQVIERSVDSLLRHRIRTFALSEFGKVVSYIEPTAQPHTPRNRVELVTHSGGEALLLAVFSPIQTKKKISMSYAESPGAASLRQQISSSLPIADGGHLGYRWIGAQR